METHKIPQHVTGYQGRILGNLTAKQFIYIALGAIVIFFLLSVLPFTTITIIFASFIGTFTLIFSLAKIDERPLDAWLVQFLLALQSTPQYVWKKESRIPEILAPSYKPSAPATKMSISERRQKKVEDFLKFWRPEKEDRLTESEREKLERISRLQAQLAGSSSNLETGNTSQKTTQSHE